MTDSPRSLTQQTVIVGLGKISVTFIAVAMAAALSRLLPKPIYGSFGQVLVIANAISTVIAVGLPNAIFYFLPRYDERRAIGFLMTIVSVLSGFALCGAAALYFGSPWIAQWLNSDHLAPQLRAFAPASFFMTVAVPLEAILMTQGRPVTLAIYQMASRALSFLAVVVPVTCGLPIEAGLGAWSLASALAAIVGFALALAHYRTLVDDAGARSIASRMQSAWSYMRDIWRYTASLAGTSVLGVLLTMADKVIVSRWFGEARFGEYRNGAMELPVVTLISASLFTVLMPRFVKIVADGEPSAAVLDIWSRALRKSALLVVPFTVFFFAYARDTVIFLYGPAFAESDVYFRLFLLVGLVRIAPFGPLVLALGGSRDYFVAHALGNATAWAGGFALVALTGSRAAAAVAYVAANVLIAVFLVARIAGRLRVHVAQLVPINHFVRVGLASFAGAGIAALGHTVLAPAATSRAALASLGLAGSLFAAVLLFCAWRFAPDVLPFRWRVLREGGRSGQVS